MFTVQVINKRRDKPIKSAVMNVVFGGFRRETGWFFTDHKGEIHFEHRRGKGKVYIKTGIWGFSEIVYEGDLEGRVVVYV
jgi:hypothetical protein